MSISLTQLCFSYFPIEFLGGASKLPSKTSRLFDPSTWDAGLLLTLLMMSVDDVGENIPFILLLGFALGSFFCVPFFDGVFCFGSF